MPCDDCDEHGQAEAVTRSSSPLLSADRRAGSWHSWPAPLSGGRGHRCRGSWADRGAARPASGPGPDGPNPVGPIRPAGLRSPVQAGRRPRRNRLDVPPFRSGRTAARCRSAHKAATALMVSRRAGRMSAELVRSALPGLRAISLGLGAATRTSAASATFPWWIDAPRLIGGAGAGVHRVRTAPVQERYARVGLCRSYLRFCAVRAAR
jgi:hypothetical protein